MRGWTRAAAAAALAAALGVAGCVEPVQYGGPIAVDHAGVAARYAKLCRVRGGAGDPAAGCPLPAR